MRAQALLHGLLVTLLVLGNLAVGGDRVGRGDGSGREDTAVGAGTAVGGAGLAEREAALAAPPLDEQVAIVGAGRAMTRSVDRMPIERLVRFGPKPEAPPPPPGRGLDAFRGLSTWVDTYDVGLSPQEQVRIAAASGVQTIFVQVSRGLTDGFLHDHARLSALIEAAHDAGLLVMVWTVPTFTDLALDVARAKAAIAFVTPRGDRPDAFGLDIETTDVADVSVRTRRLIVLSEQVRAWVGPEYPLAAIVLPPRQLQMNLTWWPNFPYAELARHYDVMIPMSYSSYRGTDAATTYSWNHDNVVLTRQLAGVPDLPVHLAGGIADELPEVAAFVRAARDSGVIGAGLYDLHTTRPEAWPALQALRVG